ncbi:hypothetical protein CXF77_04530 [Planococcus sp. MB-3u-09]|nr:hypothetical protein CW734_15430 [Planococcus sp. MB-3u-03]PKG45117.1 hypothetical protein CXF66_14975 [Planococcus sp. Urea-trap-24]PKG87459.1 hypothetical protein CXF91_15820 [Planococcus sp. Urea-3u-39]PKH42584.1 hypothetical protein CXF77_04530 [Planococcus sp. MB-3u-09]
MTSSKGPSKWAEFSGDSTLATDISDRLLHKSEILTFDETQDSIWERYRKTLFTNQGVES